MIKSRYVPVHIDAATYETMKSYADIFGMQMTTLANKALSDWMSTVGRVHMEEVLKRPTTEVLMHCKLLPMPKPVASVLEFPAPVS